MYVTGDEAQRHVNVLMDTGWTLRDIARESKLSVNTIYNLASYKGRCRTETYERIMETGVMRHERGAA